MTVGGSQIILTPAALTLAPPLSHATGMET